MAILFRSLSLRHRALSILRTLSLSSPPISFSPGKALPPPPWRWDPPRRFCSESPPEIAYEASSSSPAEQMREYKTSEIDVDDIEGCDFNHWLIVIDFPKSPRPSSEEMIRFYEETCAKALRLSLDEAKEKIYAVSTSNYTGFHVQVTETESEKFNGQNGVVFVLPDSYVNKDKKEYGGDTYIKGVIIPRPRVSKRRIWEDLVPPQQTSESNSQDSPQQPPNQQIVSSPPYTHQALTQVPGNTNEAPPAQQQEPQPQQSYYVPPGRGERGPPPPPPPPQQPTPSYPFQQTSYTPQRIPYHANFAPYQEHYNHQGGAWNYAPNPPTQPNYPHGANFNGNYSQQVGPYHWSVDQGYRGPDQGNYYAPQTAYQSHGPPQPNWQGQSHQGQPNQVVHGYQGQPSQWHGYPGQMNQGQAYQGQPPSQGQFYPGQPNQGQGYALHGDYQNYGSQYEQQQQQHDNGYQGQGPPTRYWR